MDTRVMRTYVYAHVYVCVRACVRAADCVTTDRWDRGINYVYK